MTKKEKLELYYKAKEAYYNGQEIMTDFEFDQLEKELGLENKSEVGARRNPSYTVKHPFIMGSISKVQIHKNKEGNIDWNKYYNEMLKYTDKQCNYIITPKYDGCSFEVYVNNGYITISSRGDGNWGKDLKKHLYSKIPNYFYELGGTYTLRGEVLVHKSVFEKEYAEQFTNPRSFVSGTLNRDYSDEPEFQSMLNDLAVMIYDFRTLDNGIWTDRDWTELCFDEDKNEILSNDIRCVLPDYYKIYPIYKDKDHLAYIYEEFSEFRKECTFALDGIVIKPVAEERINNTTERRPKDCVAIKFIPMLEETEVLDITWNLGKTGELTPIVWVKPVEMDGRMVQKCSGHNYGYLLEKKVSIGSKIIMSLAGDIIPFLYKVTNTDNFDSEKLNVPDNTYIDGDIHLMKILNEKDMLRNMFINSAQSLNIPNIGNETAKKIFEYLDRTNSDKMTADFFGEQPKALPGNILLCSAEEIYFGTGAGKAGEKARKSFEETLKNLSLIDIIKSCNFRFCGSKVAEQCATYMLTGDADFEHLATQGYEWVTKDYSDEKNDIYNILSRLGKTVDDFKAIHTEAVQTASNQIPVILTGEPNNYKSKGEFLKLNPQYRNTTSWKEVQIVFTNSLESNTGKMKKAREKGIELRLY